MLTVVPARVSEKRLLTQFFARFSGNILKTIYRSFKDPLKAIYMLKTLKGFEVHNRLRSSPTISREFRFGMIIRNNAKRGNGPMTETFPDCWKG
jgi:hypothetical protein